MFDFIQAMLDDILSYKRGLSVPTLEQAILQLLTPARAHLLLSARRHSIGLPATSSSCKFLNAINQNPRAFFTCLKNIPWELTLQSSVAKADSVQTLFTEAMLMFSHLSIALNFNCTLCKISRFLAHPRVLHWAPSGTGSSLVGKHIGLTKSDGIIGLSNFNSTVELPSTGDLIIPTIRRSCCQGDVLLSLTVPSLADHSAFGCL